MTAYSISAPTKGEWLAARHRFVTASDVGALLGLDKHKSRNALLKAKAAPPDTVDRAAPALLAGQFLEEGVFRWWLHDLQRTHARLDLPPPTGDIVRTPDGVSVVYANPTCPGVAASPDALVDDGAPLVVEIKVHGPRVWGDMQPTYDALQGALERKGLPGLGPHISDPSRCWLTPTQYAQVQTQMMVLEIPRACLVRCCGTERRDSYVDACIPFHAVIQSETTRFWEELRV